MWHSSLTVELKNSLEMIEKTYVSYSAALEMCSLTTLFQRREDRCLSFAQKCLKDPYLRSMFLLNPNNTNNKYTSREVFKVNFARTDTYKTPALPYLQRRLNGL